MNDKVEGYGSFITEVDKRANQRPGKCHYINYESDFDIYFPGVLRRCLSSPWPSHRAPLTRVAEEERKYLLCLITLLHQPGSVIELVNEKGTWRPILMSLAVTEILQLFNNCINLWEYLKSDDWGFNKHWRLCQRFVRGWLKSLQVLLTQHTGHYNHRDHHYSITALHLMCNMSDLLVASICLLYNYIKINIKSKLDLLSYLINFTGHIVHDLSLLQRNFEDLSSNVIICFASLSDCRIIVFKGTVRYHCSKINVIYFVQLGP